VENEEVSPAESSQVDEMPQEELVSDARVQENEEVSPAVTALEGTDDQMPLGESASDARSQVPIAAVPVKTSRTRGSKNPRCSVQPERQVEAPTAVVPAQKHQAPASKRTRTDGKRPSARDDKERLEEIVKNNGRKLVECGADGSCQFHALLHAMKQAHVPDLPNSAHELRTNLLDFLEKTDIQERLWLDHNEEGDMAVSMTTFKERLECEAVRSFGDDTTLDVYFKKLRKRNAWGDGATLLAAACVYKTVIVCYHAANESGNTVIKVTEMWHDYQPTHTIYVACLHDNHFFSTELLSPSHTDSLQCGICQQNISDACSTVSCDEHPKHASCFAEIVLRTANTFCEHESPAGACNKALPLRLVAPAIIPLMGAFLGQADVRDVTQKKFGKRLTELQLKRMKEILHLDIPLFEYPTDIPFHHYEQERNSTKSLWLCELCCDSSCFNLSHVTSITVE